MEQKMSVVLYTTNRDRYHILVAADAHNIGPQLGLEIDRDDLEPALCAEDRMNVILCEGMGHVCRPSGALHLIPPRPALTRWAT